jgi:hypothetical protein
MCRQLQHKFWGPICGRDCRLRPSAEGSANDQPKASTRAARRCPTSSEDFKAELRLKRRKSAWDNCQRSRNSDLYECHGTVNGIAAHSVS